MAWLPLALAWSESEGGGWFFAAEILAFGAGFNTTFFFFGSGCGWIGTAPVGTVPVGTCATFGGGDVGTVPVGTCATCGGCDASGCESCEACAACACEIGTILVTINSDLPVPLHIGQSRRLATFISVLVGGGIAAKPGNST